LEQARRLLWQKRESVFMEGCREVQILQWNICWLEILRLIQMSIAVIMEMVIIVVKRNIIVLEMKADASRQA